jgi:hypothetical protein
MQSVVSLPDFSGVWVDPYFQASSHRHRVWANDRGQNRSAFGNSRFVRRRYSPALRVMERYRLIDWRPGQLSAQRRRYPLKRHTPHQALSQRPTS